MTLEDYMTIRELAKYSRVGVNTLYRAIQERELAHLVIGAKKVLVSKEDFKKWFDTKKRLPLSETISARQSKAKPPVFALTKQ